MNRLKKELIARGFVGDKEMDVILGKSNIEWEGRFVAIQNGFIVVTNCTNVLDPMFIILDRSFNSIASQAIWYDNMTHCNPNGEKNPWDVSVYEREVK